MSLCQVVFDMEKYIHAFWHIPGNSYSHLEKIDKLFGDFEYAWKKASQKELYAAGLSTEYVESVRNLRRKLDMGLVMQRLWDADVALVGRTSKEYPSMLRNIKSAPFLLYRKGAPLDTLTNCVAIVGTRKSSIEREKLSFNLAKQLSQSGVTVVSGLAFGIDASAHGGVIAASGKTIGVLASGIQKVTPTSHVHLSQKILETGGAVISEYPVTSPAIKYHFVARNRIISGLSKCVIVVEAAKRSGALITAGHAAEQGRDVLVFPGEPGHLGAAGCNQLIRDGALLVDSISEVLRVLKEAGHISAGLGGVCSKQLDLDLDDHTVVELLKQSSKSLDELQLLGKLEFNRLLCCLGKLEIAGVIGKNADMKWCLQAD